jgi:hypothetical protein
LALLEGNACEVVGDGHGRGTAKVQYRAGVSERSMVEAQSPSEVVSLDRSKEREQSVLATKTYYFGGHRPVK